MLMAYCACFQDLAALESVYGLLDLYAWLGNKLGEEIFVDLDEAGELRTACCEYIEGGMSSLTGFNGRIRLWKPLC